MKTLLITLSAVLVIGLATIIGAKNMDISVQIPTIISGEIPTGHFEETREYYRNSQAETIREFQEGTEKNRQDMKEGLNNLVNGLVAVGN